MLLRRKSFYSFASFLLISLIIWLVQSCSVVRHFFHETPNGTYTELTLRSNNTFEEYVYFHAADSLGEDDYGTLLAGTYSHRGDTLILSYENQSSESNNLPESEIYIWKKGSLVKIAPVSYSHHYLNMILEPGKSKKLRALPNYDSIFWKTHF